MQIAALLARFGKKLLGIKNSGLWNITFCSKKRPKIGHLGLKTPGLTSNGQVAVSAFGSGCACPTAVIAICPICQCSAEPQLEVCSAVHPSSLCPLAAFASWALQGYACIQVNGHSLPVVLL